MFQVDSLLFLLSLSFLPNMYFVPSDGGFLFCRFIFQSAEHHSKFFRWNSHQTNQQTAFPAQSQLRFVLIGSLWYVPSTLLAVKSMWFWFHDTQLKTLYIQFFFFSAFLRHFYSKWYFLSFAQLRLGRCSVRYHERILRAFFHDLSLRQKSAPEWKSGWLCNRF